MLSMGAVQAYQPSGRFGPAALALAPLLALAAGAAAWIYQRLLELTPVIFLNFFLTLLYGFLLGKGSVAVVDRGKCRNVAFAALIALAAGIVAVASGHSFAFLRFKWREIPKLPPAVQAAAAENYGFGEYLEDFVEEGWLLSHDKWGPIPTKVSGVFVYIVWLIEAGILVGIPVLMTPGAARRPFCEASDAWAEDGIDTMIFPAPSSEAIERIASSTTVEDLLGNPPEGGGAASTSLVYVLSGRPEDREGAFLSILLKSIDIDDKGGTITKAAPILSDVILDAPAIGRFRALRDRVRDRPGAAAPPD